MLTESKDELHELTDFTNDNDDEYCLGHKESAAIASIKG